MSTLPCAGIFPVSVSLASSLIAKSCRSPFNPSSAVLRMSTCSARMVAVTASVPAPSLALSSAFSRLTVLVLPSAVRTAKSCFTSSPMNAVPTM
jgi:hypothetical protein